MPRIQLPELNIFRSGSVILCHGRGAGDSPASAVPGLYEIPGSMDPESDYVLNWRRLFSEGPVKPIPFNIAL